MLLKWCRGLFFHLYHWNFASNFFLYFLTGKRFRSIVKQKLKCYKTSMTLKKSLKCLSCYNCNDRFTSVRTPNIQLTRVSPFNEPSINDNETPESNGNVASIT